MPAAVIGERSPLEQARVREPRGSSVALYVLVCALCALFTAAVSLDGAVVLMIPLLVILARRFDAPFGALFLGAVVVANAASIGVHSSCGFQMIGTHPNVGFKFSRWLDTVMMQLALGEAAAMPQDES